MWALWLAQTSFTAVLNVLLCQPGIEDSQADIHTLTEGRALVPPQKCQSRAVCQHGTTSLNKSSALWPSSALWHQLRPVFLWKPLITSALDGGKSSEGVLLFSAACGWLLGVVRSGQWLAPCSVFVLCEHATELVWDDILHLPVEHNQPTAAALSFPLCCWSGCMC